VAVYQVNLGLVKLSRLEPDGQELIVGLRGPGRVIGAAASLLECPHATTAATLTRCQLRSLPSSEFRRLVRSDPRLSWDLLRMQSRELLEQVQAAGLTRVPARQRLEHFLWELIGSLEPNERQVPIRLRLPLRQWELALLVGVTREHLNRLLKQLEDDGALWRHKGYLMIPDAESCGTKGISSRNDDMGDPDHRQGWPAGLSWRVAATRPT
jgi:CRP-like cAMP-binding protein